MTSIMMFHCNTVPPTSTDSNIFIQILRGMYGYTGTMLHYTEECERRFRGQLRSKIIFTSACVLSLAKYGGERH